MEMIGKNNRPKKVKIIYRKKGLLLLSFLVVTLLLLISFNLGKISRLLQEDNSIIFRVNGYPVYTLEFEERVNENKAGVFSYISRKYHVQDSKNFWTSNFAREVPIELAKRKAKEQSIKIKVQQILAKEYGLIKDDSYLAFKKELNEENARRAKAIKNKEILYGPEQYGEAEYFSYLFTNMVIKLKGRITKNQVNSSIPIDVNRKYEEMLDKLVRKAVLT